MGKKIIASGQVTLLKQRDGITIKLSRPTILLTTDSNGSLMSEVVVSTILTVFSGNYEIPFTIKSLPVLAGCTVTRSGNTVVFTFHRGSLLPDNGVFDIPLEVDGKSYTASVSFAKSKTGQAGADGKPGADGRPGVDANLLDWVKDWDTGKTLMDGSMIITPKLFAGVKNTNGTVTGTAIGRFSLKARSVSGELVSEQIDGIYGFREGYRTFSIDSRGNVCLGRGEESIRFDSDTGKVVFGERVSLNWIGATYIDKDGIFTGSLHADRITAGVIDTDRLNTDVLKARLITAGNIEALELNVVRGKVGGWSIDSDSIYRGIKSNSLGGYTSASGGVTIGSTGIRGFKWRLDATGAGALAGGNISWDASGKVTFSSSVSLQWTDYADQKVNAIVTGGRNYALKTSNNWSAFVTLTDRENLCVLNYKIVADEWEIGDDITVSFDYYYENIVKTGTGAARATFQAGGDVTVWNPSMPNYAFVDKIDFVAKTGLIKVSYTFKLDASRAVNQVFNSNIRHDYLTGKVRIRNLMVERANKKGDWSPAPEDIDSTIGAVKKVADDTVTALGGSSYGKLTKIDMYGIYTGTLTATQVNAVEINASSIKTGTLNVDRLAAGSIKAAKLDANSIRSDIINTTYINGLECTFTKGKIGGWSISTNSIRNAVGSKYFIIHAVEGDSAAGSNRGHRGITLYNDDNNVTDGRVKIVQMGALADRNTNQNYSTESNYGFRVSIKNGRDIFRVDKDGAHIANWSFDTDSLSRGTKNNTAGEFTYSSGAITIGSNGIRGFKWRLDSTGAGALAGGNISWDAAGKVTFASSVSLQWSELIDKIEIGGNNLLNNSGEWRSSGWNSGITSNGGGYTVDSSKLYNGKPTLKTAVGNGLSHPFIKLENGIEYTYSAVVLCEENLSGSGSMPLHYHAGLNNQSQGKISIVKYDTTVLANKWKKIYIVFKLTGDADSFRPFFYRGTGTPIYWIASMKLEKGNRATDWSPSVSDMNKLSGDAQSTANGVLNALGGSSYPKLTKISSTGIYTGTLTADQVNAVSINATSIKTGTLSADRIAAGSLKAAKLDAASIKADIINTAYINGLSCTFVRGNIGGWTIGADHIMNGASFSTADTVVPIQIRSASSGSGNIYGGGYRPRGITMSWHRGANAGHFVFGQVMTNANTIKSGFFGIQMMNHSSHEFFCLAVHTSKEGSAEYYNRIAGWAFDREKIWKNSVSLGSDGSIANGAKWKLNNDGSGELASGKIKWDAAGAVTFASDVSVNWTKGINDNSELARAMAFGRMLYRYPEFYYNGAVHYNSTNVYVSGNTSRAIVAVTGCPNSTGYAMRFIATAWHSGTDLRIGGFSWANQSRANAIFMVRIIALIPVGRSIQNYHNAYGAGGTQKWLTSQAGTGNWAEYICKVTCGSSGSFSTINHFALLGGVAPTAAAPVTWYVAYATVMEVTSSEKYTTTIDSSGIYTGLIRANQVRIDDALVVGGSAYNGSISVRDASNAVKVTLNRSGITAVGGTIAGWTISGSQISKNSVVLGSDGTISNGSYWKLGKDGSGYVANGNISWTVAGVASIKNVTVNGTVIATAGNIGGFKIQGNELINSSTSASLRFSNIDGNSGVTLNNRTTNGLITATAYSEKIGVLVQTYANSATGIYVVSNTGAQNAIASFGPHTFGQRSGEKWCAPGVLFAAFLKGNSSTLFDKWGDGMVIESCLKTGAGQYTIKHNLGHSQYIVITTPYWDINNNHNTNCYIRVHTKTNNSFILRVVNADNGNLTDTAFYFAVIGRNKWPLL